MSITHNSYLVLPRLRVQNFNTVSSPLTWGAPAITAAIGFMHALQRKVSPEWGVLLTSVGMVIHEFDPQVNGDWIKKFNLTRNPLGKGGETLGIIEEGRAHATISLVFGVLAYEDLSDETLQEQANHIYDLASSMRFAGGSIIPNFKSKRKPQFLAITEKHVEGTNDPLFWLKRSLLPGFALLSRDDLLLSHTKTLQAQTPDSTVLDAWLDLSRISRHCVVSTVEKNGTVQEQVQWETKRVTEKGWIVPIPVGYSALSERYEAGVVANTRNSQTPFRFVESMCSIGQWVSPHRLPDLKELLWSSFTDTKLGIYRCVNENSLQQLT